MNGMICSKRAQNDDPKQKQSDREQVVLIPLQEDIYDRDSGCKPRQGVPDWNHGSKGKNRANKLVSGLCGKHGNVNPKVVSSTGDGQHSDGYNTDGNRGTILALVPVSHIFYAKQDRNQSQKSDI